MAIYAVGDIQGCYQPLVKLLDKVNFDPSQDQLWAVGDLVNRGPQSLETLRFLKTLGDSFLSVLGNHDLHFLALATGAFSHGKKESLLPLMNAPDCSELCEWLRYFPLLHQQVIETESGQENFLMVHAGIINDWTIKQALGYSAEIEAALQGKNYLEFLSAMYGDEPDCWHPDLKGMERLRVLTNIFTRMRFTTKQGKLNLDIKSGLESAPEGYKPWYENQSLHHQATILFGHWAALEGLTNISNIYALDTGCAWNRCLTFLRLQDKKIFCVDCD